MPSQNNAIKEKEIAEEWETIFNSFDLCSEGKIPKEQFFEIMFSGADRIKKIAYSKWD